MDFQHETMWTCNICSQPTKHMMSLPCNHNYCQRCLEIWVGVYTDTYRPGHQGFPCRVCWQIHYTPADGLSAYKRDFDVCQLGLDLGQLSMDTEESGDISTGPYAAPQQVSNVDLLHDQGIINGQYIQTVQSSDMGFSQSENMRTQSELSTDHLDNVPLPPKNSPCESMDQNSVSADPLHKQTGILSSHQLDTVNRNMNVESSHINGQTHIHAGVHTLPLVDSDYISANRLCYPACHLHHMI